MLGEKVFNNRKTWLRHQGKKKQHYSKTGRMTWACNKNQKLQKEPGQTSKQPRGKPKDIFEIMAKSAFVHASSRQSNYGCCWVPGELSLLSTHTTNFTKKIFGRDPPAKTSLSGLCQPGLILPGSEGQGLPGVSLLHFQGTTSISAAAHHNNPAPLRRYTHHPKTEHCFRLISHCFP